jgi:uncharacterized membrane protein YphA (DoxX/SURF4 family)
MKNVQKLTGTQEWGLILLRIFIGWHFLYEGIVKLTGAGWSAGAYLANTRGFLSGLFHAMASDSSVLRAVDLLNIWGLILIGIALIIGIFGRLAVFSGILLLAFYYIAYPPFGYHNFGVPQEGHYLLVDKTFIEMISLIVLALFPSTLSIGLKSLIPEMKFRFHIPAVRKKIKAEATVQKTVPSESRRSMLKSLAFLPFLGGFAWALSGNKKYALTDAFSGSTVKLTYKSLDKIEGKLPAGILVPGKKPVSRLIMGTNHLSGTAHGRDLVYLSSLFRAYNTEKKIIETYMLAEQAGINLFFDTPILTKYKEIYGNRIQTWVNIAPTAKTMYDDIDKAIARGVDYIYIRGAATDTLVSKGETDVVVKCIEYIKKQGYPAGLGSHSVYAMIESVEAGADPDFFYKTMHHDKYWSATPRENRDRYIWSSNVSEDHNKFHDNMWCPFPEKTVEFIKNVRKPVVGFKVLAGGAIKPADGFQWAFDNGADFIEVGMFDFQIVDNVNQAIKSFEKASGRERPWFG